MLFTPEAHSTPFIVYTPHGTYGAYVTNQYIRITKRKKERNGVLNDLFPAPSLYKRKSTEETVDSTHILSN